MFAADADFQLGLDAATFADAHFNELAYANLVEDFEGIGLDDAVFLVEFEELGSIVTREAEGHLGEVVGAEGEEVGYGGNLVGGERCTRYFDHGAYEVGQALTLLFEDLGGGGVDDVCLVLDFFERSYQRYHNLGVEHDDAIAVKSRFDMQAQSFAAWQDGFDFFFVSRHIQINGRHAVDGNDGFVLSRNQFRT